MKLHRSTLLMGAFIGGVIVAGLFGPYMISVFLTVLVAACVARFGWNTISGNDMGDRAGR